MYKYFKYIKYYLYCNLMLLNITFAIIDVLVPPNISSLFLCYDVKDKATQSCSARGACNAVRRPCSLRQLQLPVDCAQGDARFHLYYTLPGSVPCLVQQWLSPYYMCNDMFIYL